MRKEQTFIGKVELLRTILAWIRGCLVEVPFSSKGLQEIEVASEEVLVNIIRHAYREHPERIWVEVEIFPESHIEIAFMDTGPPFDPTLHPDRGDDQRPLEEREEGGLGIYLIRQIMDEVHYSRKGERNRLQLIKKWPA